MTRSRAQRRADDRRAAQRFNRLSKPITLSAIRLFTAHLIAVSFVPGEECWLYIGRGHSALPKLKFKSNGYGTMDHQGETVRAHQFAYAASWGLTLAELTGFDIHHDHNRCIGYRCSNPDHLDKIEHSDHGFFTKEQTKELALRVAGRQLEKVTGLLSAPPRDRRPEEFRFVTGAGSLQRFFAGLPFLIHRYDVAAITDGDPMSTVTEQNCLTV